MLNILIPTWRFFNQSGPDPILELREVDPMQKPGEWKSTLIPQVRLWWNLFYNPNENLRLYFASVVARAVEEASPAALARLKEVARAEFKSSGAFQYQIMINAEQVLLSKVIKS